MGARLVMKLALAAGAWLSLAAAADAGCETANSYAYFKLTAPKAMVGGSNGCFLYSGTDAKLKDVINAALARCEGAGDTKCRLVDYDGVVPVQPAPVAAAQEAPAPVASAVPTATPNASAPKPHTCPGGERIPVTVGNEPVRVNPDGYCGLTVWYRNCIYLRQAGEQATVGPYCPPEAKMMPGATRSKQFPPDVEWIWSAGEPFTAYYVLEATDVASRDDSANPPVGSATWKEKCAAKYKSFDWNTGLYTVKNGSKRECSL